MDMICIKKDDAEKIKIMFECLHSFMLGLGKEPAIKLVEKIKKEFETILDKVQFVGFLETSVLNCAPITNGGKND